MIGLAILLVWGTALRPVPALAQSKLGVVDMERAVNDCKQGKKAQVELKKRAEVLEKELKGLTDEVQNLRRDLENSAMLLNPEARLKKEREYERVMRQFNDKKRDAKQEMLEARRDAFSPILQEMSKLIQDIGASGGYSLITESRTALYFPKSADITAEVIAAYDKKHP
ncbi:MAG: OmpH family outer membrane protein [Deltaproteobacteria bacterium]|nr:OmpH family outer membrane protein [Deltaproteobacteria bacterium]